MGQISFRVFDKENEEVLQIWPEFIISNDFNCRDISGLVRSVENPRNFEILLNSAMFMIKGFS